MEIEGISRQGVAGKKVWKIVRVVLLMIGKGIAKSKIVLEFHMMLLKRGKGLVNSLMFHQYGAFTCRSHDTNLSFISPRIITTDYEFSCSNSPANPFQAIKHSINRYSSSSSKKKKKSSSSWCQYDDVSTLSAVQKVLEMLNNESSSSKVMVEASPLITLPGFGKSPIGRQLRVTDSPFPLKDDGDTQVDVAAEEFIKRFYKDLHLQKRMAALDSPYHI